MIGLANTALFSGPARLYLCRRVDFVRICICVLRFDAGVDAACQVRGCPRGGMGRLYERSAKGGKALWACQHYGVMIGYDRQLLSPIDAAGVGDKPNG